MSTDALFQICRKADIDVLTMATSQSINKKHVTKH